MLRALPALLAAAGEQIDAFYKAGYAGRGKAQ